MFMPYQLHMREVPCIKKRQDVEKDLIGQGGQRACVCLQGVNGGRSAKPLTWPSKSQSWLPSYSSRSRSELRSRPGMRGTHEYRAWLLGRNRYFQRQEGPTQTTHRWG